MSETEQVLYTAIRKVKPSLLETTLTAQTRFDEFAISSMEMAMIVYEIDDHYDIDVPPHTLIGIGSIADACHYIDSLLQKKGIAQRGAC
jgi:acyl carrier protein